jgi:hypothetical protein
VLPASVIIDRMTSEAPRYNTRSLLRNDLTRMGLIAGDTVMVHAAMSKVGPMLNGPDALSTALLDVIGPEGTLLVYTSWDSVHDDLMDDDGPVLAEWRDHVPGFDPQASRAVRMNGVIAEFIRTMPGARRSGNPGTSVAAIGKLADWITADHPQDYGYGEGSPVAKLIEANGRILMVGAPWDTTTPIIWRICPPSEWFGTRCLSPPGRKRLGASWRSSTPLSLCWRACLKTTSSRLSPPSLQVGAVVKARSAWPLRCWWMLN